MSDDLINVSQGHLIFGEAVSRVTEVFNPLGAIARIIAETSACTIEMRRISLDGRRTDAEKERELTRLADRRAASSSSLLTMHTRVGHAELNARALRDGLGNAQRELVRTGASRWEKELCLEALKTLGPLLVQQHSTHGDELVREIAEVLNGAGALSPAATTTTPPASPAPTVGIRRQRSGPVRNDRRPSAPQDGWSRRGGGQYR